MQNLDLRDVWRDENPNDFRFTWRQRNPEIHCRLDFFLISTSLLGNVSKVDILPGFRTDHSLISLHLKLNENIKGPGFWKLNTSLLTELPYVNLIKETIKSVVVQYKDDQNVNEILLWEMIKLEIRTKSIEYSKNKSRKIKYKEKLLEEEISILEKVIEQEISVTKLIDSRKKLQIKQHELENIIEYKSSNRGF